MRSWSRILATMVAQLAQALRYVVHVESFLAIGTLALVLAIIEGVAVFPTSPATLSAALARTVWASYFYLVLRRAAAGSRRLPRIVDYRDSWDTLIYPLLQAAVASLWYWVLLLVCARYAVGLSAFAQQMQLHAVDLFRYPTVASYVLLGFAMVYLPAALIVSATRTPLRHLLEPTHGLRAVLAIPRAYTATFAAIQLLVLSAFVVTSVAALVQQSLPIPFAGPVLGHFLTLWIPLAQARLLGNFAYCWRDQLVGA